MLLPLLLNLDESVAPTGIQEVVPYLIGFTEAAALIPIAAIYCQVSIVGSGGTVVSQSPSAFTMISRGQTITITMGGAIHKARKRKRRGLYPYFGTESAK